MPDKSTYKYIYAFFEKIESTTDKHPLVFIPQYRLKNIVLSERGGDGKILKMDIHPPAPPQFFKARSATVWELDFNDNNQPTMPGFDDTHILIQRCDRLPLEFYRRAAYNSEKLQNILNATTKEEQKYREIVQAALVSKLVSNEIGYVPFHYKSSENKEKPRQKPWFLCGVYIK